MFSNRLAFGALGAACIVAAAAGGYVASRQTVTPTPALAATAPQASLLPATTIPDRPVQETEAVIGDTPAPPAAAPVASPKPAATAARRPEASARSSSREAKSAQAGTHRQDPPPTLDHSWPASAGSTTPPATPNSPVTPQTPPGSDSQHHLRERRRSRGPGTGARPEPPQKTLGAVVSADSVIGLKLKPRFPRAGAHEDRVEARVTRDVSAAGWDTGRRRAVDRSRKSIAAASSERATQRRFHTPPGGGAASDHDRNDLPRQYAG
jgi:cell division protein FtsN